MSEAVRVREGGGDRAKVASNGRCDSVRVFCEAGVDRAFTASQRISSGWWRQLGVEGEGWRVRREASIARRGEDCGCENDVFAA